MPPKPISVQEQRLVEEVQGPPREQQLIAAHQEEEKVPNAGIVLPQPPAAVPIDELDVQVALPAAAARQVEGAKREMAPLIVKFPKRNAFSE